MYSGPEAAGRPWCCQSMSSQGSSVQSGCERVSRMWGGELDMWSEGEEVLKRMLRFPL